MFQDEEERPKKESVGGGEMGQDPILRLPHVAHAAHFAAKRGTAGQHG